MEKQPTKWLRSTYLTRMHSTIHSFDMSAIFCVPFQLVVLSLSLPLFLSLSIISSWCMVIVGLFLGKKKRNRKKKPSQKKTLEYNCSIRIRTNGECKRSMAPVLAIAMDWSVYARLEKSILNETAMPAAPSTHRFFMHAQKQLIVVSVARSTSPYRESQSSNAMCFVPSCVFPFCFFILLRHTVLYRSMFNP